MLPSEYIRMGWCQRRPAADSKGHTVLATNPWAAKWCLRGAVVRAFGDDLRMVELYENKARSKVGPYLAYWNDRMSTTQEEVVKLCQWVEEELGLTSEPKYDSITQTDEE